jgi:hypothetical protein
MHCFLFKCTLVLNSVLLFWKLLVFEFLLGILETFLRSVSVPQVKIAPLLDALQLLMLFAETLTYLEPNIFSPIIFYNDPNCMQLVCMYYLHISVSVIGLVAVDSAHKQ